MKHSELPIEMQLELDMLRREVAHETAIELVQERGWSQADEDYWIQIRDETERQWDEETKRARQKEMLFMDL